MSTETAHAPESTLAPLATIVLSWQRLALGAVLILAGILNFLQLDRLGLGNTYYAAAVKSMASNWHAFFFASLDPGGFVSIDKPPVAFWFQVASVKLFGFSGVSLLLPEAIAGVLSVLLLYHLVGRVFGQEAGLLAALALALTPVMVVVNRSNLVESILVFCLLLAVWAVMKGAESGQLRWLLLGAALVGIGFNIKMLEAYLVVPALLVLYLLGGRVRWYARIWHLLVAGVVLLVVSFAWITAVDLTPASQRPYVGSSGDNSELSLALGYNGIGRLTGNTFSFLQGGATLSNTLSDLSPSNLGFTRGEAGSPGWERMFNAQLGSQSSWLILLGIIAFIVVAWQSRIRLPLDRRRQSIVLWGMWLLTGGVFFSIAGFFHAYYLVMVAPPAAALAGIAFVTLWRQYRSPGWRGWALPIALVIAALGQAHILSYFADWNYWLTPLVIGASIVAAIVLTVIRLQKRIPRATGLAALAVGVVVLLLTPFIWSEYTVANAAGNLTPSAGPSTRGGFGGFGFGGSRHFGGGFGFEGSPGFGGGFGGHGEFPRGAGRPPGFPGGSPPGGRGFGPGDGSNANSGLVRYLEAHQGKAIFLVATLNANEAESIILSTDKPVMDLGGFMGADRILDVAQLKALVKSGNVRYFLVGSPGGFGGRFGGGGFGGGGTNGDLAQWVTSSCKAVPAGAYSAASSAGAGFGFGFGGSQPLYDCYSR